MAVAGVPATVKPGEQDGVHHSNHFRSKSFPVVASGADRRTDRCAGDM